MERKIKRGLLLFVVLLAAAISFFGILQPKIQERQINSLLDEANYCSSDADCTVLDTNFGCPFGCYNLGNKNADLTKVKALWESYKESRNAYFGSFCIYGCIEPPRPEEIKCANNKCVAARISPSAPFFPVQNEPAVSVMEALLSDKELVLDNGCIRAGGFLLVWPYGFSLSTDKDGVFQVINSTGHVAARIGDKIKVGGGADETFGYAPVRRYSAQLPSERCPGPYWIVGEVLVNETK